MPPLKSWAAELYKRVPLVNVRVPTAYVCERHLETNFCLDQLGDLEECITKR